MSKVTDDIGVVPEEEIPRFRLPADVDLSKADPTCERCDGTGVKERRKLSDPENPGKQIDVPVICRCVRRNGGVREDQLDRLNRETAEQVSSGAFAKQFGADVMALPPDAKVNAIRQLEQSMMDRKKTPKGREMAADALEEVLNLTRKEARHGDA